MIAGSLLLLVVQQPEYFLQLNLKPGVSYSMQMVREFSDPEDEFKMEFQESLKFRVISNEAGKVTLGIVRVVEKQLMDGQPLPLDPHAEPLVLRDIRQTNGALFWTKPVLIDAESEARLWRLCSVPLPEAPIKIGQKWSVELPDFEMLKLPTAKAKYRLAEVDPRLKTAVIWIDFEELSTKDPIKATGKATIDLDTGWPTAESISVTNARIPGGEGRPMKLELKLTTVK